MRSIPSRPGAARCSRLLVGLIGLSLCLGAAGYAASSSGEAASKVRRRPNIVFVLTDDLSLDLLRFMPHVQAMERQGLSFRDYFVSNSLCCPSRASIFTGRFPHNSGVLANTGPHGGYRAFYTRGEERDTFALALQRAGYLTALMGKYLNGYLVTDRNDPRWAAPPSHVPRGWSEWDVAGRGYPEFNYPLNENGRVYHFGDRPGDYLTDVMARKGVRFIDSAAQSRRPFFLELSTFAPHGPYVPAPRNAQDFPGLRAPRPPNFDVLPAQAPAWLAHRAPLTPDSIAEINRVFRRRAQSVEAVDQMIGEIENALRANRVAGDTYIVFSSDNGLHTGEYRLMPGKKTAFNTDIQVPLVVTGPGVRPGSVTTDLAENIDLAKTFAAIAGEPMGGDGHSLLPLLQGRTPAHWRNAGLIEHHSTGPTRLDPDFQRRASGRPPTYEALRTRTFLYVEYADGEREFYDLRRDPFELDNTAARLTDPQLAQLHSELLALEHCRTARQCWSAMHVPGLPGRW